MTSNKITTDTASQMTGKTPIENEVASPCIDVCVLDVEDVCEGCFRTMDEIGRWSTMSPDTQRNVIKLGWQRAKAAGKLL